MARIGFKICQECRSEYFIAEGHKCKRAPAPSATRKSAPKRMVVSVKPATVPPAVATTTYQYRDH